MEELAPGVANQILSPVPGGYTGNQEPQGDKDSSVNIFL